MFNFFALAFAFYETGLRPYKRVFIGEDDAQTVFVFLLIIINIVALGMSKIQSQNTNKENGVGILRFISNYFKRINLEQNKKIKELEEDK